MERKIPRREENKSHIPPGKASRHTPRAFTLIELLVVLAILGLLASLVGPRLLKHFQGARGQTARLQIEELGLALDIYAMETGSYPSTQQGLQALLEKPTGVNFWNGPYLGKKKLPVDPWHNAYYYRYLSQQGRFELYSLGADNTPGGEDENRDLRYGD